MPKVSGLAAAAKAARESTLAMAGSSSGPSARTVCVECAAATEILVHDGPGLVRLARCERYGCCERCLDKRRLIRVKWRVQVEPPKLGQPHAQAQAS